MGPAPKIALLYFITQSVGSLLILSGGIVLSSYLKWVLLGLLLKGRFAPFHFWGLIVLPHISHFCKLVFLTWQKVAPVFVIFVTVSKVYLSAVVFLNVIVSTLCSVGSKSLFFLIFFSGIMQMGWIFSAPASLGFVYLVYYFMMVFPVFVVDGSNLPLLFFNLAGLPPFTGFLLKLEILTRVRCSIGLFLLIFSLLILYSYLRIFLFANTKGKLHWMTVAVLLIGHI